MRYMADEIHITISYATQQKSVMVSDVMITACNNTKKKRQEPSTEP